MLLYNPKGSLAGLPDEPQPSLPPEELFQNTQDMMANSAVAEILPVGGLKILEAQEAIAKSQSKEAQDILANLLTEDVKMGIRALSVLKYVVGFAPMMHADKQKKIAELVAVTRKLRAWAAASQLYGIALNERYNTQIEEQIKKTEKLLADLVGVSTHSTTAGPINAIKVLKNSESNLMLAQVSPGGGGSFPLSEFRGAFKTEVTSISWFGPVASRVRVAKQVANADSETVVQMKNLFGPYQGPEDTEQLDKIFTFPVPDICAGYLAPTVNPVFYCYAPGYADYIHYDGYQYNGMNKGIQGWNETKDFDLWAGLQLYSGITIIMLTNYLPSISEDFEKAVMQMGVGPDPGLTKFQYFTAFINEQVAREYSGEQSKGKTKPTPKTTTFKYDDKTYTTPAVYTFGFMIDVGLTRDPEWGSNSIFDRRTPHWVADNILWKVHNHHNAFRVYLTSKVDVGEGKLVPTGELAVVQADQAMVKSEITDFTILPPLPVVWSKKANGSLTYGGATLDVWQKYIDSPALEVQQNFATWVDEWNKRYWGGKGPTMANLVADVADTMLASPKGKLAAWTPVGDKIPALPYPLDYPLAQIEFKLPKYMLLAAKKWGEISKKQLSASQEDLLTIRSDYKSDVLVGMRAAEFADAAMTGAEGLLAAIQTIAGMLYGDCVLVAPPEGTVKEKLYDHYYKQTEACKNSPKPGSLVDVLNQAKVLYDGLKAKAETGDSNAKSQTIAVAEQIAKIQTRVNVLIAELKGKLEQIKDDMDSGEGSAIFYIAIVEAKLKKLSVVPEMVVNGVKIKLPPSDEESEAIKNLAETLKKLNAKYFDIVAKTGAIAQTLINIAKEYGIHLGDNVGGGLASIKSWSVGTLGEEKSSFPWWIILAAALAAQNK